jgi:hypothetical protein
MKRFLAAALFTAFALISFAPASAQVYKDSGQVPASGLCTAVTAGYAVGCAPTIGDTPFAYDAGATKTLTQVIAAPTAGSIRIPAGFAYGVESATGGTLEIETGTGSNCASSTTIIFAVALGASGLVTVNLPPLIAAAKTAVCFTVTAGTLVDGGIFGTYAVY